MKVIEELSEYILFLEIIFLKYIIDEGNYKKVKDIMSMPVVKKQNIKLHFYKKESMIFKA